MEATIETTTGAAFIDEELEALRTPEALQRQTRAVLKEIVDELKGVLAVAPKGAPIDELDVTTLWYPRDGMVAYGVWANEECEEGDGEWRRSINGWSLPDSPPWVEVLFRVPQAEAALQARLDQLTKAGDTYYSGLLRPAIKKAQLAITEQVRAQREVEREAEFTAVQAEIDRLQAKLEVLGKAS